MGSGDIKQEATKPSGGGKTCHFLFLGEGRGDDFLQARRLRTQLCFAADAAIWAGEAPALPVDSTCAPSYALVARMARQSWSGQLVPLPRQLMPSRRARTSSQSIPLTSEQMPWRFPWQPPSKATSCNLLFSIVSVMRLEHTPWGMYS